MSAGLAHEVNQPLTAVRVLSGNTLKLLDAGRLDTVRRNLQSIEAAVDRMGRITQQLKSFARRASARHEAVDLASAVGHAQAVLEHRLQEADVSLRLELPARLRVRCDPTRLEQVLLNLMGNAVDAMQGQSRRELVLRASPQGGRVQIEVVDSGTGLSPEAQARLFEPFFTTKPAGQGLGLGLVISAQIVQEFGGRLSARSGPEGTVFSFELPTDE
jgi:two-component system C4-dicarboxylate transport sensor histidine kinase DctB